MKEDEALENKKKQNKNNKTKKNKRTSGDGDKIAVADSRHRDHAWNGEIKPIG